MAPQSPAHPTGTFATQRTDNWWVEPLILLLFLSGFLVYAMWRVFEIAENPHVVLAGAYHYTSPFMSVDLTGFIPASWKMTVPYLAYPALLVLPFPAGFRFTCYYFRKAYYRSFVARPAGCSTEAWKGPDYKGEKGFLVFQNLHRYFLYATLILLAFHAFDSVKAFFPHGHFRMGLGNVLLVADTFLLGGYVLGCHAFRHLVGGRLDCYSCDAVSRSRHSIWQGVTILNQRHMFWALASIISIVVTDYYLRWLSLNPTEYLFGVIPA